MAKKRKKKQTQKIYIAITVAAVIIATAIFIETSGLSRYLKTNLIGAIPPGGGACYVASNNFSCILVKSEAECLAQNVNYKRFVQDEGCLTGHRMINDVKSQICENAREENDAFATAKEDCLADVNREILSPTICGPNETFEWIALPEQTQSRKEPPDSCVVWCAAVIRCVPKPPPTLAESCAALDPLLKLHCSAGECGPLQEDGAYECPAGKVCDVTNVPLGRFTAIKCGEVNDKSTKWATADAYCPRLYATPRREGRACREGRLTEYDSIPNGNGDRAIQESEAKTNLAGICPDTNVTSCIGKEWCDYKEFDIAKCGNPKPLDTRKGCLPYVGSLTVSCRGNL